MKQSLFQEMDRKMAKTKKESEGPVEAKCDLTPMIDVTFLLLIFFVLNIKFKVEEGEVENFLPKDKGMLDGSPSLNLDNCRVKLLWVAANGSPIRNKDEESQGYVVVKIGNRPFNAVKDLTDSNIHQSSVWSEVHQHIEKFKERNRGSKKSPVIIDARPQVPYQYVARALNEVIRAGVDDVTFAKAESDY